MHPSSSLYHVLFYNNNGCTKIHAEQGTGTNHKGKQQLGDFTST